MPIPLRQQLSQLMQPGPRMEAPPDPRAAAIEQYMQSQGNQSPMPTIDPNALMASRMAGPGTQDDQGNQMPDQQMPPWADPRQALRMDMRAASPAESEASAEDTADEDDMRTDEDDLQHTYDQMDRDAGRGAAMEPPDDESEWPDSPDEFEQMYGRPPTTDREVEHYYGEDDPDEELRSGVGPQGRSPQLHGR